jgi:iron-sulfur cluster assembly accessory protein
MDTITLTSAASARVKALLEDGPDMALRIAVRSGGCSGFSYEMYFDSETLPGDERIESDGVAVIVDASSRSLLAGATLDFVDSLQQSGFKMSNPQASRQCGCGQSFGA